MPEEERQELIAALKKKWEVLMRDYQKESHHGKLDTIGKMSRKEVLEAQMDQVEADIKKLQKNYIFMEILRIEWKVEELLLKKENQTSKVGLNQKIDIICQN